VSWAVRPSTWAASAGSCTPFDDDPAAAGAGEGGFGDAESVDTAAQHLQGAVGGFAVGVSGGGRAGLQHDLRAAAQIETEVDGHTAAVRGAAALLQAAHNHPSGPCRQ
jgi:hypothetical protein